MSGLRYYPPAISEGAWLSCKNDDELYHFCGMKGERLRSMAFMQDFINGGHGYAIVILKNGYLAAEYYSKNVLLNTTFDIHSCTKSFTSIAFGCLIAEKADPSFSLDSKAYDYIPEGFPLTDSRKADITIGNLLSMTSGLPGESRGYIGITDVLPGSGEFEYALGKIKSTHGSDLHTLAYDPGSSWDYSDSGYLHLSMIFNRVAGRNLFDYMKERVFKPIKIENAYWDVQGGYGNLGPFSNPHTGLHFSARELSRVGYLLLNKGNWNGKNIIPTDFIERSVQPSQQYNPDYGTGFWNNVNITNPLFPADLFMMKGYNSNRVYMIPSIDLVVVRLGDGPTNWDENILLGSVLNAIER